MLHFAREVALEAGEVIRTARRESRIEVQLKGGAELVTATDLAVDRLVRQKIGAAYPQDKILTEESVDDELRNSDFSGRLWIVDPIDGTANFVHGQRHVAVSIALAVDGVVQLGVVHAPFLGETFTAEVGKGAFCNGVAMSPRPVSVLSQSIVGTGFPHVRDDLDPLVDRVRRLIRDCRDIRRLAAPAIDISWVGMGRLDGHCESVCPWDVAAAGLIAREAGARRAFVRAPPDWLPEDLCGDHVLFATPEFLTSFVSS